MSVFNGCKRRRIVETASVIGLAFSFCGCVPAEPVATVSTEQKSEQTLAPTKVQSVTEVSQVSNVRSTAAPLGGTRMYFDITNKSNRPMRVIEVEITIVDKANNEQLAKGNLLTRLDDAIAIGETRSIMLRVPNDSPLDYAFPETCIYSGKLLKGE